MGLRNGFVRVVGLTNGFVGVGLRNGFSGFREWRGRRSWRGRLAGVLGIAR